jgi:hypothetical protein
MSFILDALKKSETDRQRQNGPALFEVRVAPPKTGLPLWAIGLGGLLAVNLVIVAWVLLRRPSTPDAAATAANAAQAQSANAGRPSGGPQGYGAPQGYPAPQGYTQGGYPPAQAEGGQAGYAGQQGYAGGQGTGYPPPQGYPGGQGQQGYPGGQVPAGQGQQYAAAGYSGQPPYGGPNGAENGYPQGQPGAGRPPGAPAGAQMGGMPQSGQGAPGAANGGDAMAQAEAGGEKLNPDDYAPAADAGPAPAFKQGVTRATSAGVPLYRDAAALPGVNIPQQLRLDLHVFAAKPQDRFVMINMHKLHEGDSTPDGVHVEGITPEGAVLSKDGVKFLLPRD